MKAKHSPLNAVQRRSVCICLAIGISTFFLFTACLNFNAGDGAVKVTGVMVSPVSKNTTVGSSFALTAQVTPPDAKNRNVIWSSSNPSVATVDSNGVVYAVGYGGTAIMVTTADGGFTDHCIVTAAVSTKPVTGVALDTASKTLRPGENLTLRASVAPPDADNPSVSWQSSNTAVATVDDTGIVSARSRGTATITVKTDEGNFQDVCAVTVRVPVTGISVSAGTKTIGKGQTFQLNAWVSPAGADDPSIGWTSSNTSVATVDSTGLVTGLTVGTATITARSNDGGFSADCQLTVSLINVTGVSLDQTVKNATTGSHFMLYATVLPAGASNPGVTWNSSDTGVATVDANGMVTAVAAGTAIVTVTTVDGSFAASCVVTVTNASIPVTGITLNASSRNMDRGTSFRLSPTISPSNASNTGVFWTSSNPLVAQVDLTGLVTALSAGSAVITATTEDGAKTASCSISVTVPVLSITLNATAQTVLAGATFQLTAAVLPADATNQALTWTSSSPAVATVSSTGLVTAVSSGTTVVTATSFDGSKTAVCAITVPKIITGIVLNSTNMTLDINTAFLLTASPVPADAAGITFVWSSSDSSIASVSPAGLVTARGPGTVTVTATSSDGRATATCVVRVVIPVNSISITPPSVLLLLGGTQKFVITFDPPNATDKTITWTSSAPSIVSVSSDGTAEVKGLLTLAVTVTATTSNGKTATATITKLL